MRIIFLMAWLISLIIIIISLICFDIGGRLYHSLLFVTDILLFYIIIIIIIIIIIVENRKIRSEIFQDQTNTKTIMADYCQQYNLNISKSINNVFINIYIYIYIYIYISCYQKSCFFIS